MTILEAKEILVKAIDYNEDGSCKKGSWCLSTDGIEAIKLAINALENNNK